jgi:hypothetical protein
MSARPPTTRHYSSPFKFLPKPSQTLQHPVATMFLQKHQVFAHALVIRVALRTFRRLVPSITDPARRAIAPSHLSSIS